MPHQIHVNRIMNNEINNNNNSTKFLLGAQAIQAKRRKVKISKEEEKVEFSLQTNQNKNQYLFFFLAEMADKNLEEGSIPVRLIPSVLGGELHRSERESSPPGSG